MKLIVLTLCLFVALINMANAAIYYRCVDSNGRIIFAVTPLTDAKCELKGENNESRPNKRQQSKSGPASDWGDGCDIAVDNVDKSLQNVSSSRDVGDYCRAADGIKVTLNLLRTCEDECRDNRIETGKIADWKRQLTTALAVHQKECDAFSTGERKKVYSGSRVSLDIKNADINAVFRLLSDVGKVNIVSGDDVKGTLTLKLKSTPWDEALDTILYLKELDKRQEGKIITVFTRNRK